MLVNNDCSWKAPLGGHNKVCMYVCMYLGDVCVLILPECSRQKKHTARHLVWEYQKRTEPLQMSENSNC